MCVNKADDNLLHQRHYLELVLTFRCCEGGFVPIIVGNQNLPVTLARLISVKILPSTILYIRSSMLEIGSESNTAIRLNLRMSIQNHFFFPNPEYRAGIHWLWWLNYAHFTHVLTLSSEQLLVNSLAMGMAYTSPLILMQVANCIQLGWMPLPYLSKHPQIVTVSQRCPSVHLTLLD